MPEFVSLWQDLPMGVQNFLLSAGGELTAALAERALGWLAKDISGTATERALRAAYKEAGAAFLRHLPIPDDKMPDAVQDYLAHYADLFNCFFASEIASHVFVDAVLHQGTSKEIDAVALSEVWRECWGEGSKESLPFNFDTAVVDFALTFERAVKSRPELHSYLQVVYLEKLTDILEEVAVLVKDGLLPIPTALHQLPSPPDDFTGRQDELKELKAKIEKDDIKIVGLFGLGGVGKTALALKLAETLKPRYPDAQFYLDLRGTGDNPLSAAEAMISIIRAHHPTAELLEDEAGLPGVYRSVLYGKRALLLMDNAAGKEQVGPLIPPASCLLLITSRQHFVLPGLYAKNLNMLPPDDACTLLQKIASRVDRRAGAIAKLCGYLPLALRLAGSALAERVNLSPSDYTRRLEDEQRRCKLIDASLSLSYELLEAEMQKLWCMLSIFPGTFDTSAAEMVWGLETDQAEDILGELLKYSLVEFDPATDRYRLHDLVRLFASQRISKGARDELETNVIKSLRDPVHRYERALTAGECLLDLGWSPLKMRLEILEALYELMQDKRRLESERRTAAFLLTHLDWLADVQIHDIPLNAMLAYLELIARYVYSSTDRRYLVQSTTSMLESESVTPSDRQRAHLLVYRAAMWGKVGELDSAARDYEEAKQLVNELIGSPASLLEDHKLSARIDLGAGNIAMLRAEKLTRPEDQGGRTELLQEAVNLCKAAAGSAQIYGQDVILEATIYRQLSYAYALLKNWAEAEQCYHRALDVLADVRASNPEAYVSHYAWGLERASVVHWLKGKSLYALQNGSSALREYETAHTLTQQEIEMLQGSLGESRRLVMSHINAGDYLLEMSRHPDCDEPQLLAEACRHWRTALDMARRLGISDMEQEASERFERHCQDGDIS